MSGTLKQSIAFAAALTVGTLLLFLGGRSQPGYLPAYSVIMLVGLILAWNLSRMFKGDMPWYSPHIAVLGFMFLIEFAAPVAVVLMGFESNVYKRPLLPEELFPATVVSLIGVLGYLSGWRIGPKRHTLSPTLQRALGDTPSIMWMAPIIGIIIFFCSIAAWAYMFKAVGGVSSHLQTGGSARLEMVSTAGGFVWHIARFGYAGVLLYFAVKGPRSPVAWIMIGTLALILTAFGSRSYLVILILGALIVYRMRFTNRTPITLIVTSGVILFFIATFLVQLRFTEGNVSDAKLLYMDFWENFETFIYLIFGHLTFIIQRAELLGHLNETGDFQFGKTYLNLLDIVPGVIWPAKYDTLPPTGARYYMEVFFPQRIGKTSLSSNIFTEMYLNFAWPGVFLGGIAFGMVIRWIHSRFVAPVGRYNNVISTVAIAILAMSWFRLQKSGTNVLVSMYYLLFPLTVLSVLNFMFGQHRAAEEQR